MTSTPRTSTTALPRTSARTPTHAFPRMALPMPLRAMMLAAGVVAALALHAGPAQALAQSGGAAGDPSGPGLPEGAGTLVVVGGALAAGNEAVYQAILGARQGDGPLCVVPTAGANPAASAASAVARFDGYGGAGTAMGLELSLEHPEAADDPAAAEALASCSGYFFTGGVQSRILDFFLPDGRETPAWRALMERWRAGAVVSGSSAGAAMMSNPMIAGGPPGGIFQSEDLDADGVNLVPGMGFLDELLVDQHFLARGRIGRLVEAVLTPGSIPLGAGIDENTALVVSGNELEVVGASGVIVVDARAAGPTPARLGETRVGGIRVELLGPGDRMTLEPGAPVRPAPGRVALPEASTGGGEGEAMSESEAQEGGIFTRWTFLHRLEAAAREGSGAALEAREAGGTLVFTAGPGFRALGSPDGEAAGPDGSHAGLSAGPFELSFVRYAIAIEPGGDGGP
jgi:cyanophycinase